MCFLTLSAARKGQATEIPQIVAQVVVSHFKHHSIIIGCQHQRCQHYCLREGTEVMLNLVRAYWYAHMVTPCCFSFKVLTHTHSCRHTYTRTCTNAETQCTLHQPTESVTGNTLQAKMTMGDYQFMTESLAQYAK